MRARGSSLRATDASSRRTLICPSEETFCGWLGADAAAPTVGTMSAPAVSAAATKLRDSLRHRTCVRSGNRARRDADGDGGRVGDRAATRGQTGEEGGTAAAQRNGGGHKRGRRRDKTTGRECDDTGESADGVEVHRRVA